MEGKESRGRDRKTKRIDLTPNFQFSKSNLQSNSKYQFSNIYYCLKIKKLKIGIFYLCSPATPGVDLFTSYALRVTNYELPITNLVLRFETILVI